MDAGIRALVEAIHASPTQVVIYAAGGASQALGWLLSVPGASSTVLESLVPYSRSSMVQLLGKIPIQFNSQQTVEEMASLAYNRALKLSRPGLQVLGIGFTGSLATSQPKHGDHRFYLSTRKSDCLWTSKVTLMKGLRTREEEDRVSSQLLLKAIANTCNVSASFATELHESEVPDECEMRFDEEQELEQIIDGKIHMKTYYFSSDARTISSERRIILSGSFNPLHDGHIRLLEIASSVCSDGFPCFELSAVNADKPPLTVAEIKNRVQQFQKTGKTVIVSNQPYFYKKAELFPGSAFVIGADTAARLINVPLLKADTIRRAQHKLKYYGGDHGKMLEILIGCKNFGTKFLVGGRKVDGVFKILEDFDVPEEIKDMFISIPEDKFRMDLSSTEIREKARMC